MLISVFYCNEYICLINLSKFVIENIMDSFLKFIN